MAVWATIRPGDVTRRFVLPAAAVLLAIPLLAISLPRLGAGLANQPGNQIKTWFVDAHSRDRNAEITVTQLAIWQQSRQDAVGLHATADDWSDLALIDMLRADARDTPEEREALYEDARDNLQRALLANPNSGLLWLRRAVVDLNLDEPPDIVMASIETSIAVAPYEPSVFFNRMLIGFHYWPLITQAQREMLLAQLPMMAEARSWNEIKRLARLRPERIPEMREWLKDSPRGLETIDLAIRLNAEAEN